jgi:hypothetical protein
MSPSINKAEHVQAWEAPSFPFLLLFPVLQSRQWRLSSKSTFQFSHAARREFPVAASAQSSLYVTTGKPDVAVGIIQSAHANQHLWRLLYLRSYIPTPADRLTSSPQCQCPGYPASSGQPAHALSVEQQTPPPQQPWGCSLQPFVIPVTPSI